MNALAIALSWAAGLAANERNFAEVDRLASETIELSTRHNFAYWLAVGAIWHGWVRSAPVTPRKASRGSSRELETIGQPVRY